MLPPGGHPEKGELPYDAVHRELQEELGLENASIILTDGISPFFVTQVETVGKTAGHTDVDLWYLVEGDATAPLNTEAADFQREFGSYKWRTLEEILEIPLEQLDKHMHRFVRKLLKTVW